MTPLEQIFANNPSLKERNPHIVEVKKVKTKKVEAFSKYKAHIHQVLSNYCLDKGYTLLTEHRFHDARKFRFDWAIKEIMMAVEYEGLNSDKSRHTTKSGFTTDTTKYNLAQSLGWSVFRYTALNYLEIETILK